MAKLVIGTSGWHYGHWRGPYYPTKMKADEMLPHYCRDFRTVEINNSYYQLPSTATLDAWRRSVPDGFLFSVKASRYITHLKKLKDFEEPLDRFLVRLDTLNNRLGPILFQLPPRWHFNPSRLKAFLAGLPDGKRFAVEFRDAGWYNRQSLDMLREHGVALCIHDMAEAVAPKEITADFLYLRFHGPQTYRGCYDTQTLAGWAGAFSSWLRQRKDIYCYFNNDEDGHAVHNALALKGMMES